MPQPCERGDDAQSALQRVSELLCLDVTTVRDLLPAPVVPAAPEGSDPAAEWFMAGSPALVVLGVVSSTDVTIGVPVFTWPGPSAPVLSIKSPTMYAPARDGDLLSWIEREALLVTTVRLRSFRRCAECRSDTPPEWMHDGQICQTCATDHHGVVY